MFAVLTLFGFGCGNQDAEEREAEKLETARLIAVFNNFEDREYPAWADTVLRGNDLRPEACKLFRKFLAGVEIEDRSLKTQKTPPMWAEVMGQSRDDLEDFEGRYRDAAFRTAKTMLWLLQNPPLGKLSSCKRFNGPDLRLRDKLEVIEVLVASLRVAGKEPPDIGTTQENLRNLLITGAREVVEELRPRLKDSADAQGAVQWLLERYALEPEEVGLTKEEVEIAYGREEVKG